MHHRSGGESGLDSSSPVAVRIHEDRAGAQRGTGIIIIITLRHHYQVWRPRNNNATHLLHAAAPPSRNPQPNPTPPPPPRHMTRHVMPHDAPHKQQSKPARMPGWPAISQGHRDDDDDVVEVIYSATYTYVCECVRLPMLAHKDTVVMVVVAWWWWCTVHVHKL